MTSAETDHIDIAPPLIPRRLLFADSALRSPRLSPDGRQLGYLAPSGDAVNVWIGGLGPEARSEPVTREAGQGVRHFFFCCDGRHLCYGTDAAAKENWRLAVVDLVEQTTTTIPTAGGADVRVIAHHPRCPDELILGINDRRPEFHDVYRYTLSSGRLEMIFENESFAGFFVDSNNGVRGALRLTRSGGQEVFVRDHGDSGEWRPVYRVPAAGGGPIGFSAEGRELLILTTEDAPALRLVALDLVSGDARVIAEDDAYDVANVALHPVTSAVQMVSFRKERTEWRVIDPSIGPDIAALQEVDGGDLALLSRDAADERWLVYFNHDIEPPAYWLWDRTSRQATRLFERARPDDRYRFAEMKPFSFAARDGLTVHGYATVPVDGSTDALPTVVLVHGGPWTRDTWGFHPLGQWLANRGYLCVQVNFRGSTGYGKEFLNKGNRQWGRAMQEDLLDAIEHLVERGDSNPRRVAIFGHSYGGYAALAGSTMPEVFACAVALAAPVDLRTVVASLPPARAASTGKWHTRMGDPTADAELLTSASPVDWTDRVRVPLLVAHGTNDPRASHAEVQAWVTELHDRGAAVEFVSYPGEGHGLVEERNRLDFFERAERFLARHLGGRLEPSTPSVGR